MGFQKLASPGNLVTDQHSRVKIEGTANTAIQAYAELIAVAHHEKSPIFASTARGFRPVFRLASVELEDFITEGLRTASHYQPIKCIRVHDGWIFFGAI